MITDFASKVADPVSPHGSTIGTHARMGLGVVARWPGKLKT